MQYRVKIYQGGVLGQESFSAFAFAETPYQPRSMGRT